MLAPPPLTRVALAIASLSLIVAATPACTKKVIPARGDAPGPEGLLEGGRVVFQDDFNRGALGERWQTAHAGWTIVDGWVHSRAPKNVGLWLKELLPEGPFRIEFSARSEPREDGSFPGDLKCEVLAAEPAHQGGYIVINGGWNNSLDVIARRDEHGKDRLAQAAHPVAPSVVYRWAIVRAGETLYWFRDGALIMSYTDDAPLTGRYFGFNNWETSAYFDDLKIYELPAR